jgi:branched-chain amino acid transport system ATP-binding protein
VSPAMLEIDALDVSYGGVAAVRGLSLEVGKGEIVGLIGPNGAGKSTTLHAVMGLVEARRGEIRLAGASLQGRAPEDVTRSGISLVPEGRRIFADLTVEENLRLGLSGRRSREGAAEEMEAVYALFPIVREFRRRRAGVLSGRPRLILLDEPSLGLAPKIVDVVFDALSEIRSRGITVLLVEQRAQRTVAFADRTYLMANGEIRLTMTPADAADTDTMVAAYLS